MARLTFKHSEDWIEKLLAIQELTPSERQPLLEHVVPCATCAYILNEYYALAAQVRLLLNQPAGYLSEWRRPQLEGLPPQLLEMWREEDRTSGQENERHNYLDEEVVSRLLRRSSFVEN